MTALRYWFFGLLTALGALALLTALLSSRGSAQTASSLPAGPIPANTSAPDFTLSNLKGEAVALSQLRGRPVLLFFWATW